MSLLTPIIIVIAAVAIVVFQHISWSNRLKTQQSVFDSALAAERAHSAELLEAERIHAARALEAERAMTSDRFKAIAGDVLRANSRSFSAESVNSLLAAIAPMKESLDEFRRSYRECYDAENRDRSSLREEIRLLSMLSQRVQTETSRLSSALRGNTGVQGRWGEMVLSNILEHSGLQKGRWFATQESSTDEEGNRLRPDAVIHCPQDRDIIIDAKTNITHYLRSLEADDDSTREALIKEHVRAVERQMTSLGRKEYQNKTGNKSAGFVIMFMPHEGAYAAAMTASPSLWEQAYDNHVIIASPTHLITVVRLVEQMWHTADTNENARRIADTASVMLDSVAAFSADFESLGRSFDKARQQYDSVAKRLATGNNNILRVAERLRDLGVKASK